MATVLRVWTQEELRSVIRGWEILEHPPNSPVLASLDFQLFPKKKNIFVPSDSNHMLMSSIRCKHGCVVRIPPSVDRVLRNGFPAYTSASKEKVTVWENR